MKWIMSHFTALHVNVYVNIFSSRISKHSFFVLVPPKITSEPRNHIANEMDNVSFHCTASGKPEPTITWTRDGQNVGSGEYLNFTAQTNLDGSVYKCTAENGVGQPASSTATLTLLGMWILGYEMKLWTELMNKTYSKNSYSVIFLLTHSISLFINSHCVIKTMQYATFYCYISCGVSNY